MSIDETSTSLKLPALLFLLALLASCGTLQHERRSAGTEPEEPGAAPGTATESPTLGQRFRKARESILPGREARYSDNIWDRVIEGFAFDQDHSFEQIAPAVKTYAASPAYLSLVSERAAPFIYAIVEELDSRGLPMELALLPIVESAYDPRASSSQAAAGLWQFMSATATGFGLRQDWWYDGRQDPVASTAAALDYLETLYNRFDNDWLLALAAYNAGQGTVSRAIRLNRSRSLATDFWSLNLPSETQNHIPRLLALAHIFANAEKYQVELTPVKNEPFFARVNVGSQIDLSLAARLAEIDPDLVYQLNPGFKRWATHPDGPHEILVPIEHKNRFIEALATVVQQNRVTWQRYTVRRGDTLSGIAERFQVQVSALRQVNGLRDSRIIAGEPLLIPYSIDSESDRELVALTADGPDSDEAARSSAGSSNLSSTVSSTRSSSLTASPAPRRASYIVRAGDSLWRIARQHKLEPELIARWNGIAINSMLQPGQVLTLSAPGTADSELQVVEYEVRRGDSLARIARIYQLSVHDIANWNGITEVNTIHPGQQLVLRLADSSAN